MHAHTASMIAHAPQLRVLVLTSMQGALNLGAVAEALGVHASNATRTGDRCQVELSLTSKGRDLVESVMSHRRAWARKCCPACRPAVDAP